MDKIIKQLGKVVPTVAEGIWSKDIVYEKLTFVTGINGGTFLSRYDVPQGINTNDTKYWLPIGDSESISSVIEIFKKEVNDSLIKMGITIDAINEKVNNTASSVQDAIDYAEEAKKIADSAFTKVNELTLKYNSLDSRIGDINTNLIATTSIANKALDQSKDTLKRSDRGVPGGIPILDSTGKVPQSQLPLTKTELVDSYESTSKDKAPTADALRRATVTHNKDMEILTNQLNAVLNLVGDSIEIGVSPTVVTVDSVASEVTFYVITTGEWTVENLPERLTATPMRGTGSGNFVVSFPNNNSATTEIEETFKVVNGFGKEKSINSVQLNASTTYKYNLQVTPSTIEFSPLAGTGSFEVVSTRTPYLNNEPVGEPEVVAYSMSSPVSDSWFRINKTKNTENYSYDENILEASRSTVVTITQNNIHGLSVEIPVNQLKAEKQVIYKFESAPKDFSINDGGAGNTYKFKITSTRTTILNGVEETIDVPFTTAYDGEANSSWITIDNTAGTIILPINNNENARSGNIIFTQEGISNQIIVPVSQKEAIISWDYSWEVTPASLSFGNAGGSKSFSVTKSTKIKTINGTPVGDEIQVPWTVKVESGIFGLNTSTLTVSAPENSGERRTGRLVFNRTELGEEDKKYLDISQEAGVVTWNYILEASCTPTTINALNGSTVLNVVSKKQKYLNGVAEGQPIEVAWHATSSNGYLSGQDISGSSWNMTENKSESSRVDNIIVNQLESGSKSKTITVTQLAGTVTYEYSLNVSPTSISLNNAGSAQSVNVVSVRQKKINNINSGGLENVNWSSAVVAGEINVSGATVSASPNNTEAAKSGRFKITQADSGKTVEVSVTQPAGTVGWNYTFTVNTTSLNYSYQGGSQNVNITSTKQKTINGINSGGPVGVSYSSSASGSASVSGTSISMGQNNTLSGRSGSVTFTQAETNKQVTVSCTQGAGVEGWNYTFNIDTTRFDTDARGATKVVGVTSYKRQTINGSESGVQTNVGYASSGGSGTISVSGNTITASENLGGAVSANITFTQNESGNSRVCTVTQTAVYYSEETIINCDPAYVSFTWDQYGLSNAKYVNVICNISSYRNGKLTGTRKGDWRAQLVQSGDFYLDDMTMHASNQFVIYPQVENSTGNNFKTEVKVIALNDESRYSIFHVNQAGRG